MNEENKLTVILTIGAIVLALIVASCSKHCNNASVEQCKAAIQAGNPVAVEKLCRPLG